MAYVITDTCSKDELCVKACPVDCIHPTKGESDFDEIEGDVPPSLLLRVLFYLRLSIAGAGHAVAFLRREREVRC